MCSKSVAVTLATVVCVAHAIMDCDQMFIHTDGGPPNGTFSSPNYGIGKYPPDLQCIYTFVAKVNYRVKIVFDDFVLTGTATNCNADYIDVYSELVSPEVNLVNQPYSGRYCGTVSPRIRISYRHVLVIVFHVRSNSHGMRGFHGSYQFIPTSSTETPGACGFVIKSSQKKSGTIVSPTYPGTYPRYLHCYYRLEGKPGERIRLYFNDFDLYFGGEHCPYDSMTIYDGSSNAEPIIRKMCGLQQKVEIFSEKEHLYLEFNASKPSYAEHRGFSIDYKFSNHYVDVAKLTGGQSGVSHMRGSQCDIRVISNRETTHVITSPNYPDLYPANTTCVYLLDGLQGLQNLEKVLLKFHAFSIASPLKEEPGSACSDSYVGLVETQEQQKVALRDPLSVDWDHQFCGVLVSGKTSVLRPLESSGPRLIVVFRSGDVSRRVSNREEGFKATVEFQTDFGIPGEPVGPASNKCQFKFDSLSGSVGSFNSPRYPSNYPVDTNCTYFLNGQLGERVRLSFEQFHLKHGLNRCGDWLELYDVFPPDQLHPGGKEQFKARYCAEQFPGPLISAYGAHKMRVVFHSDHDYAGTGFKANYDFTPQPKQLVPPGEAVMSKLSKAEPCGGRLGNGPAGWFASPGFDNKYIKNLICNWEIKVRPGYRILLQPVVIKVEGEMGPGNDTCTARLWGPAVFNCQQAVIHVYTDLSRSFSHQFCGTSMTHVKPVISKANVLRISFYTAPDKVNGLEGFNFSWTEVREAKETGCYENNQFRCIYSKLCIDESLRCNDDYNCGEGDKTDESHCESKKSSSSFQTMILAGAGGGLVLLAVIIIACVLLRRYFGKAHVRHHHHHHHTKRHQFGRSAASYSTPRIKLIRQNDTNA